MYRQKEKVDDAYPLHRMRKKQMEHTWTKEFYQETDPAKRQHILKEHIGEEEAWEEEYRARLWTARYSTTSYGSFSLDMGRSPGFGSTLTYESFLSS